MANCILRVWGGLVVVAVLAVRPAGAAEPVLYGGIEVGAKGIKGVAIPIDETGVPRINDLRKLKHTMVNNVTLAELKQNKFVPEALEEARAAVHDYYQLLTGELHVPPERIWIVASSGLTAHGRAANFNELAKAVAAATEFAKELKEIDQPTEVELTILGAIPRENRCSSMWAAATPRAATSSHRPASTLAKWCCWPATSTAP
jgi:hypothetical protein